MVCCVMLWYATVRMVCAHACANVKCIEARTCIIALTHCDLILCCSCYILSLSLAQAKEHGGGKQDQERFGNELRSLCLPSRLQPEHRRPRSALSRPRWPAGAGASRGPAKRRASPARAAHARRVRARYEGMRAHVHTGSTCVCACASTHGLRAHVPYYTCASPPPKNYMLMRLFLPKCGETQ